MLKRVFRSPRLCFVGAMLIAVPAIADAPIPSQEFWEYMTDYSDDNGDVLDPLEYDQILSMKETDVATNKKTDVADEQAPVVNKVKVKSADMKCEHKSSLQSSSAGTKGARL